MRAVPLRARGFTLIELLVAIAIFAIMAGTGYGALRNLIEARTVLAQQHETFAAVSLAVNVLRNDIESAVARSVRDEFGDDEPALRGGIDGALLQLTRHSAAAAFREPGVDLRRIEYRVEDGALFRYAWNELDRFQGSTPKRRMLLAAVRTVGFRFFDGQWDAVWPVSTSRRDAVRLPRAVEVSVAFADGAELRRVFEVGG